MDFKCLAKKKIRDNFMVYFKQRFVKVNATLA